MRSFVHLHVHTEYSLLDGMCRIKQLVAKAKEFGMPAVAITDHGVLYGAVEFYKAAKDAGIKPIIGCEVYVAPRSRKDKEARIDDNYHHLVLLAKNTKGYKNLLKLVSMASIEGFYYRPRVDKEILMEHSDGLIALSACLAGEIPQLILNENTKRVLNVVREYQEIFGKENFYLELQDQGLGEQKIVNDFLIKFAQENELPLVATNDVHYLTRSDARVQDILVCIQTGKTLQDTGRMQFLTEEFFFKSTEEMHSTFTQIPEALENTLAIAEKCNVELELGKHLLPSFSVPDGQTPEGYLEALCWKLFDHRYENDREDARARLAYELAMISKMGFASYFLIVWDFISYAKRNHIPVGPGRGSAAGSLVAYVLEITDIDPIENGLIFERFLNPERVSMPDIDVDFCYERRNEVIDYVTRKYGNDRVAQIITFGTMAAKAAIRDVGRVMGLPYGEVDKVAKLIPHEMGITLKKALHSSPELQRAIDADERIKDLINVAISLEGISRHASTHAAGIVISPLPLTEYLPLQQGNDGGIMTQYAMEDLSEIGLLKMDFLGLRTLTVMDEAAKLIAKQVPDFSVQNIDLADASVYEMLGTGETLGIFQLESSGMRSMLKDFKPVNLGEIAALLALYRPGPLASGMVDDLIKSKHGKQSIEYIHPMLEPILMDTYGVILYQEQVMRIANELAGFTLGEADLLRRAMGKKKPDELAKQRNRFVQGAAKRGIAEDVSHKIFDLMEYFAGYGFAKSHSTAYALISYQTAYLKTHYPLEFMSALLTSVFGNSDKISVYISECKRLGIQVITPDVNISDRSFSVFSGKISFGLIAIKNLGRSVIDEIIAERKKGGKFTGLQDFCERMHGKNINKRVLESLIRAGAFDSFGYTRTQNLAVLDQVMEIAYGRYKQKNEKQILMFDVYEEAENLSSVHFPELPPDHLTEILAMEKEMLGVYISGHPLDQVKTYLTERNVALVFDFAGLKDGSRVTVAGLITGLQSKVSKAGQVWASFVLDGLAGGIQVILFPNNFVKYKQSVKEGKIVSIKGRIQKDDDVVKLIAEELEEIDSDSIQTVACTSQEKFEASQMHILVNPDHLQDKDLERISVILQSHNGNIPVYLHIKDGKKERVVLVGEECWIEYANELEAKIRKIVGNENLWFE